MSRRKLTKRELYQAGVERRGGCCKDCKHRKGKLDVVYPASGTRFVWQLTGDNATVFADCNALGKIVKAKQHPTPEQCCHYNRDKLRKQAARESRKKRRQHQDKLSRMSISDL
jgi:peroxiredoxin family protein